VRRVMIVYGTRPEAVKVATLITALRETPGLEPVVAVTGQHRQLLDQVNELFGIVPDHDLDILQPRQTLADVTTRVLTGATRLIQSVRPDAVVVQGDTTTSFAAALAAFYEKVPVVHVEAGLRTDDRYSPFPEEVNRRLTGRLASVHLAPTATNRANLLAEGIAAADVVVTGNTVIDALLDVVARRTPYADPALAALVDSGRRVVLVTTHRRESWGEPMRSSMTALAEVAGRRPEVSFVLPLHRNPVVREVVEPILGGLPNVLLTEALPYAEFARLMNDSALVVTDSGGVQEEAPSLGKPVLVLRDNTERPEAVTAGTVRLIGTSRAAVRNALLELLDDEAAYARMANAVNPYGDGKATPRCVAAIAELLGTGSRIADFDG
jgi:UDP-N-acetylglucosamine 2-epimerase (non-hydrolysing)